jgi:tetratricopeptide (TPR) repeat protein
MHGEDHPAYATDLNVLGVLLMKQDRYEQAESILRRSLAIRERVFGDAHPLVATALNNLGTLLEKQNKFEEAEPFFSRALEIRESNLGPEHKHTIHSQNNLTSFMENKELDIYNKMKRGPYPPEKKSRDGRKSNHNVTKEYSF